MPWLYFEMGRDHFAVHFCVFVGFVVISVNLVRCVMCSTKGPLTFFVTAFTINTLEPKGGLERAAKECKQRRNVGGEVRDSVLGGGGGRTIVVYEGSQAVPCRP
jgi:hypothetical protein